MDDMTTCSAANCSKPATVMGMCRSHYKLAWKRGQITADRAQRNNPVANCAKLSIDGLEYEITPDGRIWSVHWRRFIKPDKARDGYLHVVLGRKLRHFLVHRLVLQAWRGTPPAGAVARHLDGTRDNNRIENLAWGTAVENQEDSRQHGTLPIGERHGRAKLTDQQVREIRSAPRSRGLVRDLCARFGAPQSTIYAIRKGTSRRGA